jgi:hypothetical protein
MRGKSSATDESFRRLKATRQMYFRAREQGRKDLFDRIDLGPALQKSLDTLLPEYREVVGLIDIEDCSYAAATTPTRPLPPLHRHSHSKARFCEPSRA